MKNLNPKNLMRIESGPIYLRPLLLSDAEDIFLAIDHSRDELRPWMSWEPNARCAEDQRLYIRRAQMLRRKGLSFDFGIFDILTHAYLGGVGVGGISNIHRFGEMGYWVRSDRCREGIGYAAAVMILRFAFEIVKLHKVKARANVANGPSLGLLCKLCFTQEGISRDDLLVNGKWGDHAYFGMLITEYEKQKKRFDREVPWKNFG
jgi:RimJ/RimL family protein N-acetyltransferase